MIKTNSKTLFDPPDHLRESSQPLVFLTPWFLVIIMIIIVTYNHLPRVFILFYFSQFLSPVFLQGLAMAGNPRSTQEYYDSIDRKDPRKAVVIPRVDDEEISRFGTMILAFLSVILVLVTLPFSLCYCVKVVQEYERAVIFRLGRLKKGGASGPGLFFILPCIDKYSCVDLRTVSYEVPPQEMLSRDSVTVSVDAVCFYKVTAEYDSVRF